ncbi:enoyl-CoA hydratase/carnithine racemase [Bradyrhizobium sp. USDA 4369]
MSVSPLKYVRKGAVATVRLEPADGRVLLTPDHLRSLSLILTEIASDADIALMLLESSGYEFCLGADLSYLRACRRDEAERYLRQGQSVIAQLEHMPIPTIAAVGGTAMGGGFELALACDLCWAHPRATFSSPELRHQLVPAWHAIPKLRRIPSALAWELLMGHRISARRAHEVGLVGRLFGGGDFLAWAEDSAATLAGHGRTALNSIKTLWKTTDEAQHDALAIRACFASDHAEELI